MVIYAVIMHNFIRGHVNWPLPLTPGY